MDTTAIDKPVIDPWQQLIDNQVVINRQVIHALEVVEQSNVELQKLSAFVKSQL